MKEDINLALSHEAKVSRHYKKIFIISLVSFFVILLICTVSVIYGVYQNTQIDSLNKNESDLRYEINLQASKKAKIIQLHDRLSKISSILKTRKDLNKKIDTIFAIIPVDGMSIERVDADEGTITIQIISSDLSLVNSVLESVYNLPKDFVNTNKVDLISFTRLQEAKGFTGKPVLYEMSIRFYYTIQNG